MQIVISCDEEDLELIRKYIARGRSPYFKIHLEHDSELYPDGNWYDFGLVILGWWIVNMDKFLTSAESNFSFMDGPYSLTATAGLRKGSVTLTAVDRDLEWEVDLKEFVKCFAYAVYKLRQFFIEHEIECDGINSLDSACQSLKKRL